jgi:Ser/Thr protein kinase RdoA (MazF antagonist)
VELAQQLRQRLGATAVRELTDGHQSRVFVVTLVDGHRIVAKVLDASSVDADHVIARVDAVARVADLDPAVCRPIPIDGRLVNVIDGETEEPCLLLCSEFAEGAALDARNTGDAEALGSALARLHRSLARVDAPGVPEVAAVRTVGTSEVDGVQLLHGDFNAGNLRRSGTTIRVFDFEDCGYGPRAFDVANALYMVLFDFSIGHEHSLYREFEQAFLLGYEVEDGTPIDRRRVRHFVDLRVEALEQWLDDLPTAPTGIRMASPQWHDTLRAFVSEFQRRRH